MGPRQRQDKDEFNALERAATECESHVSEVKSPASGIPSNAVQVELCMNLSRPWDKAKYYLATDSGQVP